MKFLHGIRSWFGRRSLLGRRQSDRPIRPLNIEDCRKVGIVYFIEDESSYRKVKVFVDKLRKEIGIRDVMAMGYVAEDDIPSYLLSKLNFEQICDKDLNWKLMPSGNKVVNFITEDYDILIDLSIEDHLPIQHLVSASKARFKVGRFGDMNNKLFDMMIDMAGVQSLSQYINQVDKYLHMLNAKKTITT